MHRSLPRASVRFTGHGALRSTVMIKGLHSSGGRFLVLEVSITPSPTTMSSLTAMNIFGAWMTPGYFSPTGSDSMKPITEPPKANKTDADNRSGLSVVFATSWVRGI